MKHAAQPAVTTSRLVHFDILRIGAVFAVVLLHAAAIPVLGQPIDSTACHVSNLYDSAVRFCVPVLVMLSGVFFLNPDRPVPTPKLFSKYLKRIAITFVVWSAAYVVFDIVRGAGSFTLREAVERVVAGGGHLWFLYMIAGLYLVVPLLRPIAASVSLTRYFLGLWVVFGLFGALLKALPQTSLDPLQAGLTTLNVHLVVGYTGYFLLGSHLARHRLGRGAEMLVYAGGVVGFLWTAIGTWWLSDSLGGFAGQLYAYPTPDVALVTVAVFTFFNQRVVNVRSSARTADWIVRISACTFGAYLVHMMFLNQMLREDVLPAAEEPLWAIPALAVIVFVASMGITALLRYVPAYRRYLS